METLQGSLQFDGQVMQIYKFSFTFSSLLYESVQSVEDTGALIAAIKCVVVLEYVRACARSSGTNREHTSAHLFVHIFQNL